MKLTSRSFLLGIAAFLTLGLCALTASAQTGSPTGSIRFDARIRAAAGVDEPVRQANFYLLRKSYTDIQAEARVLVPDARMVEFIDKLDVSKELKAWMKKNDCVHLSGEEYLKKITPDDMVDIKEFYDAYLDRMAGDQTVPFPTPKYKESDKVKDPEKYDTLKKEYKKQVKEFYAQNLSSVEGLNLSLEDVDPGHKWDVLEAKNKGALDRETTILAEGKYLVARGQTDLDGKGYFRQVPAGTYWLSSLNVESLAGEERERWDTPVTVTAGHESYVTLSNINAVQTTAANQ